MTQSRLLASALAGVAVLAAPAVAQTARPSPPSKRPVVTVPLPDGSGVLYYRSGTPGGVRIRSRNGSAAPDSAATPLSPPSRTLRGQPPVARAEPSREGLSRLDLLLLEQRLLDAIDRGQYGRDRSSRDPSPRLPLPPTRQIVPVPAAPITPARPTPPARPARPATPAPPRGPISVHEIERSILETGLFRTTAVHFEFARAELLPVSTETLDIVADVLRRYPALRIEVGGHTDNVGSDAINDPLSQRRAESVTSYLDAVGVSSARLSAVGYGERRPVASNDSETGRALNRRVEFTVLNPEAAQQETTRESPSDDLRQMIREEVERLRDDS